MKKTPLFLILLLNLFPFSLPAAPPYHTTHVFIYVIDGARYTETFGDTTAGHGNISCIWNKLRPLGCIYTQFFNNGGDTLTETCPGHCAILTGAWQHVPNNGSKRPDRPTIFEYFRKQTGSPASENYVIMGKNKLYMLTHSDCLDWGAPYGASYVMPTPDLQYSDTAAWTNIQSVLKASHPKLAIANMPEVDICGHSGNWKSYIRAIRRADSIAGRLWELIQSDSVYRNTTTLLITNDHGRHTDNFSSHGDTCYGCRHIMLLVIGPDTRPGVVDAERYEQIDIAPTVGALMGFTATYAQGRVIKSIISKKPVLARRNTKATKK